MTTKSQEVKYNTDRNGGVIPLLTADKMGKFNLSHRFVVFIKMQLYMYLYFILVSFFLSPS